MVKTIQVRVDNRLKDSSDSLDAEICEAIARKKAGERFYTSDEFLANMKAAIEESVTDARTQI